MVLLEKIKESAISVIPVMLMVCLLHFTAAPLGDALGEFLVGGVLLILGLSVFCWARTSACCPWARRRVRP